MRKSTHPALFLVLLAGLLAALFLGVQRYRYRFVHDETDLISWLPEGESTTLFADFAALRQAGYLSLLANGKTDSDPDYREFIRQTGFDYSRNLDAVAGSLAAGQLAFAVKGQFDWSRLRSYASSHGGICTKQYCSLPGTHPNRWISFAELQPDVAIIGVSDLGDLAYRLISAGKHPVHAFSSDPVWLHPAHSVLQNPASLPVVARIFAISLQSADEVTLSVSPSGTAGAAFDINLDAPCQNGSVADTIRSQLQMNTKLLAMQLRREHVPLSNADISGLLTSGNFFIKGKGLKGTWPVHKELVDSLR